MNNLLKNIIVVFLAITFSNTLVDFGMGEEFAIMKNPILFLGTTLIISVICGYLINWVHINSGLTKKEIE